MSHKLGPVILRPGFRALPALLVLGALGGCAFDPSMPSAYLDHEASSYAAPDSTAVPAPEPTQPDLLTDRYGESIQVTAVQPANIPQARGMTVTQTYTPDPAEPVLTVRGLSNSGHLVGVRSSKAAVLGQTGPIPGTLAFLDGETFTEIAPADKSGLADQDLSISQISVAGDALAWTTAPTGTDQWQVFYQSDQGEQSLVSRPSTTHKVLDGTLDITATQLGDVVLWGTAANDPAATSQQKFFAERFGEFPNILSMSSNSHISPALIGSGLVTAQVVGERSVLDFNTPHWLDNGSSQNQVNYRPSEQVSQLTTGSNLMAALVTNQSDQWIDVYQLDGELTVSRIVPPSTATFVSVCGSRVAWLGTDKDATSVYVYDSVSNALVTMPTADTVGELFCSNTAIATTLFDTDGAYLGAEVTTWH